jgi:hypothetical protein
MLLMSGIGWSNSVVAAPTGWLCESSSPGNTIAPLKSRSSVVASFRNRVSLFLPTAQMRSPVTARALGDREAPASGDDLPAL